MNVAPSVALVSGDFVTTGGMDRANLALASYLARSDLSREVHVVAHRVDQSLSSISNLKFHRAPKPLDSYLLGAPMLDHIGRKWAKRVTREGGRVIVNGANCDWPDVNWAHYVHAAWNPGNLDALPMAQRVKARLRRNRALVAEATILPKAKLVIANSNRTKRDLIERVGVREERIRVVYYGIDPAIFYVASEDERRATRRELGLPNDRPIAAFIGSPNDVRKGFDVVQRAWKQMDSDLIVLGRGDFRARENIHSFGFRDDVPRILRACDALISPTRYEAYGLAIHEAICCGVTPIVSAQAGIVERFPDWLSPLLLHDVDDPDEPRERIASWKNNLDLWRERMKLLADDWRTRTWDDMATEFESLL